jgi:probable addiction module antidote protein
LALKRWDSAEYLKTEEDIALYLQACFEEAGDDAAFIAKSLGTIARARSMTQLAKDTGLGRESLYKALSGEGNPSFATILKVINALGLKLHIEAIASEGQKNLPTLLGYVPVEDIQLPIYLDKDIIQYLNEKWLTTQESLQLLVNDLLRKDIEIAKRVIL